MKIITFILILPIVFIGQIMNQKTFDEKSGKEILTGYCNREAFTDSLYSKWFDDEYNLYSVDTASIDLVVENLRHTEIKIVLGTWCSDSRREVPRIYKILDSVDYPKDKVTLISVDRKKLGLEDEVSGLNIELVPTIILYQNEIEIGRIIESPEISLEEDIVNILISK
ncbi:MAG: thioredoxin [Bacteroidota bacterium]